VADDEGGGEEMKEFGEK